LLLDAFVIDIFTLGWILLVGIVAIPPAGISISFPIESSDSPVFVSSVRYGLGMKLSSANRTSYSSCLGDIMDVLEVSNWTAGSEDVDVVSIVWCFALCARTLANNFSLRFFVGDDFGGCGFSAVSVLVLILVLLLLLVVALALLVNIADVFTPRAATIRVRRSFNVS